MSTEPKYRLALEAETTLAHVRASLEEAQADALTMARQAALAIVAPRPECAQEAEEADSTLAALAADLEAAQAQARALVAFLGLVRVSQNSADLAEAVGPGRAGADGPV